MNDQLLAAAKDLSKLHITRPFLDTAVAQFEYIEVYADVDMEVAREVYPLSRKWSFKELNHIIQMGKFGSFAKLILLARAENPISPEDLKTRLTQKIQSRLKSDEPSR